MSKETKALTINPQLAAFQEELLKNYDKANLSDKKGTNFICWLIINGDISY
jgi:hypothetical protein